MSSEQKPEEGDGGSYAGVCLSCQAEEWQVQRAWGRNVFEASRRGHGIVGRESKTPGIHSLIGFFYSRVFGKQTKRWRVFCLLIFKMHLFLPVLGLRCRVQASHYVASLVVECGPSSYSTLPQ